HRIVDEATYRYEFVNVEISRAKRTASLTVKAPVTPQPQDIGGIQAQGAAWWPLQMARELDDAILCLRTNQLDIGTWLLKTEGDPNAVLAVDVAMLQHADNWFVRETVGMLRRTFARLEISSRSLFALIEPGSCFAGTLFELALAADRSYMLHGTRPGDSAPPAAIRLTAARANSNSVPAKHEDRKSTRLNSSH